MIIMILVCIANNIIFILRQAIGSNLCEHYRRICEDEEQRTAFFSVLASDLGVQHDAILAEAKHLSELYSQVRER